LTLNVMCGSNFARADDLNVGKHRVCGYFVAAD